MAQTNGGGPSHPTRDGPQLRRPYPSPTQGGSEQPGNGNISGNPKNFSESPYVTFSETPPLKPGCRVSIGRSLRGKKRSQRMLGFTPSSSEMSPLPLLGLLFLMLPNSDPVWAKLIRYGHPTHNPITPNLRTHCLLPLRLRFQIWYPPNL